MNGFCKQWSNRTIAIGLALAVTGCSSNSYPPLASSQPKEPFTTDPASYNYLVGPGDSLNIFIWRNPEVSQSVTVRPDGKITTPLVEDIPVSGLTPTQIARLIEDELSVYIKEPIATVLVDGFVGPYSEQVRVIGEAEEPEALSYRQNMTLLDVMIEVEGLTEFADGNGASIVRVVDGVQQQYGVRIKDLIQGGEIDANVDILPGDIIIIPESWF
ncbi:MAG: XrtA/PEP-CTERM system exopolysaccharide export protein [Motiliproteus sp.]